MTIEFRCPRCSQRLRMPDQTSGERAKCSGCGVLVDVPAASSSPPVPQADAAAGLLLIRLSLIAYTLSFFLPAFNSNESTETFLGLKAFFLGLFGLLLFQPTWLANPAFWVGVVCAARRSWNKAAIWGVLATGLALVALLLFDPGAASASQGGTSLSLSDGWTTRLTQLMPGYWCWLASMVLFLSGSVLKLWFPDAERKNPAAAGSSLDAGAVSVPADGQGD